MNILILYWTKAGSTLKMARAIARGVDSVEGATTVLRCAPSDNPDMGPPPATLEDLKECDGLIVGSPAYFGNMAAPLKAFFDQTTPLWLSGSLCGKPAGVFVSVGSMHGGHETTLISMILPLLHHGMLICSIPCVDPSLSNTRSGGTPYGPSHYAGLNKNPQLTEDEKHLCQQLGKRVACIAVQQAKAVAS